MRAAGFLFSLLLAAPAFAQFDVAVSVEYQYTPMPGSTKTDVLWPRFTPPRVNDWFAAMTMLPDGRVVAAYRYGGIFVIRPDGETELVPASVVSAWVFAMTANRDGVIYAITGPVTDDLSNLIAIEGSSVRTIATIRFRYFSRPGLTAFTMDLAADQCTLWYPRNFRTVGRFNVCTATQLADIPITLPQPGSAVGDVRVLPDGGALVGGVSMIRRISAAGVVTRDYLEGNFPAGLALGRDGRTFLTVVRHGDSRVLVEHDVESGVSMRERAIAYDRSFRTHNLVVEDSWYAAFGNHAAGHDVPALDVIALVAFAALLTVVAVRRV